MDGLVIRVKTRPLKQSIPISTTLFSHACAGHFVIAFHIFYMKLDEHSRQK